MLLLPRLSNPDPGKDFPGRGTLSERSLVRSEEQQRGGEMEGKAAGNEAREGGWMGRRSMIQVVQGRIKESDFAPCEVGAAVEF